MLERSATRDPHRGPTQGTHTEGTHTEGTHTGDPRDPNRGPTQRGGGTEDPHRTHTDKLHDLVRGPIGNPIRQLTITGHMTCVAAPSPRASLGRRTVCGRTEQLSAAGFEALRN